MVVRITLSLNQGIELTEKEKIIEPIQFFRVGCSIVPVLKRDRKIRICDGYKVTINQVSQMESIAKYILNARH